MNRVTLFCLVIISLTTVVVNESHMTSKPLKVFKKPSKKEKGRIINGVVSAEGAWPFMASIGWMIEGKDGNVTKSKFCGGSIWNEDTILTAAHCFLDEDHKPRYKQEHLIVILGQTDVSKITKQTYLFKVKSYHVHKDFDDARNRHDIAILKLDKKIDFAGKHRKARCVCDPEPLSSLNTSACIAMGWGRIASPLSSVHPFTSKLRQVRLPIHSDAVCKEDNIGFYRPQEHLCAGGLIWINETTSRWFGTCTGDSGGPLVCPHKDHPQQYVLVGVSTFGKADCNSHANYFTRVSAYLGWINQMAGEPFTEDATFAPEGGVSGVAPMTTLIGALILLAILGA